MSRIKDITNFLELLAPLPFQESYDNAGLIVGDAQVEVTGVLVTLDSTEAVLDEAIAKGCNLIIAHHPIVFKGLKKLNGKNYVERTVIKAIKNGVYDSVSISYYITDYDFSEDDDAIVVQRALMNEVSLVSVGADSEAKLIANELREDKQAKQLAENKLKELKAKYE